MNTCNIKNQECEQALPFGGCWYSGDCVKDTDIKKQVMLERDDIKIKLNKLKDFIKSDKFNKLSLIQQFYLNYQTHAMEDYLWALENRLNNWDN